MGDGKTGHQWRAAAALAALVTVTAVGGLLIAISRHPPATVLIVPPPIPTATPMPTPSASLAPPDLSGAWGGLCSGLYSGYCSPTLMQSGAGLVGTFMLSSTSEKLLPISGNLIGSAITLRGGGVVFEGTLSGSTLAGSYFASGKTGSWSVTLTA